MEQQPVVQQEVPPKAEGKSTGDKILGFFGLGEKSQEDKNEEMSEIDNKIVELQTKKKELQGQSGTDIYTADSKGGRRRSRKQTGGRRRRTRRGKRSGCKRCGLKRCGCSKKRRTRR